MWYNYGCYIHKVYVTFDIGHMEWIKSTSWVRVPNLEHQILESWNGMVHPLLALKIGLIRGGVNLTLKNSNNKRSKMNFHLRPFIGHFLNCVSESNKYYKLKSF